MWKVGMSEEVGKALHAVVDKVNQAAARRPKVSQSWEEPVTTLDSRAKLSYLKAGVDQLYVRQNTSTFETLHRKMHITFWYLLIS